MAVPKRKISKSKKRQRRAHHAITPTQTVACARCGVPVLPHAICENCGHYRGKPMATIEEF